MHYGNPYFSAEDLQNKISELNRVTSESIDLSLVHKLGYTHYALKIALLSKEIREIALCLDSLREGMCYEKLSEMSGFPKSEVMRILKHKRPQ